MDRPRPPHHQQAHRAVHMPTVSPHSGVRKVGRGSHLVSPNKPIGAAGYHMRPVPAGVGAAAGHKRRRDGGGGGGGGGGDSVRENRLKLRRTVRALPLQPHAHLPAAACERFDARQAHPASANHVHACSCADGSGAGKEAEASGREEAQSAHARVRITTVGQPHTDSVVVQVVVRSPRSGWVMRREEEAVFDAGGGVTRGGGARVAAAG
jgi:hypothetical protein